jgi:hypothetical protein
LNSSADGIAFSLLQRYLPIVTSSFGDMLGVHPVELYYPLLSLDSLSS